jgi:hypothetical protein
VVSSESQGQPVGGEVQLGSTAVMPSMRLCPARSNHTCQYDPNLPREVYFARAGVALYDQLNGRRAKGKTAFNSNAAVIRCAFPLLARLRWRAHCQLSHEPSRTHLNFLDPPEWHLPMSWSNRALARILHSSRCAEIEWRRRGDTGPVCANPSFTAGSRESTARTISVSIGGALPLELFGRPARRTEVAERGSSYA